MSETRQIGVIVVRNGKVVGFEMAGHPETFDALKKDIYQKYAMDIAAKGEKVDVDKKEIMEKLIQELREGKVEFGEPDQNVGGQNIFIETPDLRGSFFQRGNEPIYVSIVRK